MRIAVVVRSLKFGGMERVAVTLAESFVHEGHDSHLIYFAESKKPIPVSNCVQVHSFELRKTMKRSPFGFAWKIISQILNLFIRNSFFVWSGLYWGPIFRKKVQEIEKHHGKFDLIIFRGQGTFEMIWPIHDSRFVFVNESLIYGNKHTFLQQQYAKLLFKNRKISAISSGVKNSFERLHQKANFPIDKHVLITNPIDLNTTLTLSQETIKPPKTPYILTAGRFHPVKNIPLLIAAYAYAREHLGLKEDLVILGEGRERVNIEKTIQRYHLEKHVHLKGYIENPYPWMREAKLFVLSSKIEGLGMVLLESMACGTDVVATRSLGGIKDVLVGALASHISEADSVSLAKKIVEILKHPIEDFSNYLEPYSAEHIARQFIKNFTS